MSGWDIQPDGVRSVLASIDDPMRDLVEGSTAYLGFLTSACTSTGTLTFGDHVPPMGLVGVALTQYAQATQQTLPYLVGRTRNSVMGARTATTEYLNGATEMAANAQREALKAPDVSQLLANGKEKGHHK
ncbi:DUF6507 family protein [Streptomyces sp. QH1-20]|uniref:DUF6507 family protein n=1 Tax=Streptomyces sp. QH1-20 TaxID=3240934 RepID=UPI0035121085